MTSTYMNAHFSHRWKILWKHIKSMRNKILYFIYENEERSLRSFFLFSVGCRFYHPFRFILNSTLKLSLLLLQFHSLPLCLDENELVCFTYRLYVLIIEWRKKRQNIDRIRGNWEHDRGYIQFIDVENEMKCRLKRMF